jgi:hypothetical protein
MSGENLPNNFPGAHPARVGWLPCCHLEEKGNLPRVHSTCGDDFLVVVGKNHIKFKHAENRKFIKIYKHKKHQESFYARKNENVLKNKENYMYIP